MEIPLSINYFNSFDVKTNPIIWNWAGFIKVHLKHLYVDDLAFLEGDQVFALVLKGKKMLFVKIE